MKVDGVAVQGKVGVAAVLAAVRRRWHGDADGVVDGAELRARDGDSPALVEFYAEYPPETILSESFFYLIVQGDAGGLAQTLDSGLMWFLHRP